MLLSEDSIHDWKNFTMNHVSESIKEEQTPEVFSQRQSSNEKHVSFVKTDSEVQNPVLGYLKKGQEN